MSDNNQFGNATRRKWVSAYDSWYPSPAVTEDEETYLKLIESIFKVKYPDGRWDYIKLTNHQAEFHRDDLAIKKFDAKNRIVIKSRGTSFTTDAIISMCMATYSYRDQLPPAVRINDTKVKELFQTDFKEIIDHMTPLRLEYTDENEKEHIDYFPFNNKLVQYTAHEIYLPDRNIRFTAYPANSTSSENIRGNRINFGLMDETNYILSFSNIDTAMLDATRGAVLSGADKGKIAYQATYGTTRKGRYTSFNKWLESIERLVTQKKLDKFKIYRWPALDPTVVDLDKALTEQEGLTPIAPWQTIEHLEQRRIAGINTFKEEYMAMLTDDEGLLYDMQLIADELLLPDSDGKNINKTGYDSGERFGSEETKWKIGIDPAYSGDFFAISIFKEVFNEERNINEWHQTYTFYKRKVDLTVMQDDCETMLEHYIPLGLEFMEIDGHGLGVQLSNYLQKLYPKHVRLFRGTRIKIVGKNVSSVPIKEFLHTNQIMLQQKRLVKYLPDSIQLMHFSGWDQRFEFNSQGGDAQDMAHGDTTIANGLALLPKNLTLVKYTGAPVVATKNYIKQEDKDEDHDDRTLAEQLDDSNAASRELQERLIKLTLDEKMKHYKNIKFRGGV